MTCRPAIAPEGPALHTVPDGGYWTAAQVAEFLSMSEPWVWKQVRLNSGFPFRRFGPRCVRFPVAAIREWAEGQEGGGR